MLFTTLATEPPKLPPLIEIVQEIPKEEPKQEEPIITWRDNPQGCNEDTHYIAAESPFYCIPKQNTTQRQKAATSSVRASYGINWYPRGQCTWYVATRRPVGAWNDASSWAWQAARDGWTVTITPRAGAIAWKYGHVAYVESVSGNMMTISEANYDYKGSIRTITIPVSSYAKFIY